MNMDVKYGACELIDVPAMVDACKDTWFNQSLCRIDEAVLRLGILHGEFHWHHHDDEDELFFVLSGKLVVETDEKRIELAPHQGCMVPKGVRHRTLAPQKTVVLMIERADVVPTGDGKDV